LVDAEDSKSSETRVSCGFESRLRHVVTCLRVVRPIALGVALGFATRASAQTAAPPSAPTDSLGLAEATAWLTDSVPRAGSFTLHDQLNGQPMAGTTTRVLGDVHVDGCTMHWTLLTIVGTDTTRFAVTAALQAVDPALAAAAQRDSVHTAAGWRVHSPSIWEVSAPTRDRSTAEQLEKPMTTFRVTLPALSLFVTGRDNAWRTAAAVAAVTRACQAH
jgi:hypothetical protein